MKVFPHANAKKKTERLKGFKLRIFVGHYFFKRRHGSEGVKMAVIRFSSLSRSLQKLRFVDACLVTLSATIDEPLKWLSSLPTLILNAGVVLIVTV